MFKIPSKLKTEFSNKTEMKLTLKEMLLDKKPIKFLHKMEFLKINMKKPVLNKIKMDIKKITSKKMKIYSMKKEKKPPSKETLSDKNNKPKKLIKIFLEMELKKKLLLNKLLPDKNVKLSLKIKDSSLIEKKKLFMKQTAMANKRKK